MGYSYMLRKQTGGRCIEDIQQIMYSLIFELKNISPLEGPPKEVIEKVYELKARAESLCIDLTHFVDWYNEHYVDSC